MRNLILGVIIVALLGLVVFLGMIFYKNNSYERFTVEESCKNYYEKCLCLGAIEVRESYPPQYECLSKEYCWDEIYSEGENC